MRNVMSDEIRDKMVSGMKSGKGNAVRDGILCGVRSKMRDA
jgi:hypothetical protein